MERGHREGLRQGIEDGAEATGEIVEEDGDSSR